MALKPNKKIKVRAQAGHISRLPSGSFRAELMVEGKRARETFPTEEGAQQWLERQVRLSTRYGISLDKSKVTVSELVDLFIQAKELENRKATTIQSYEICLKFLTDAAGSLPVQHLGAEQIQRLLSDLKRGIEGHKPFAPKTLRNVYGTIHGLLEFGVAQDILERNTAEKVNRPQWSQSTPRAWSQDQVATFLTLIENDRLEAMWWLFLGTGLRVGELCALKWDDLKGTQLTIRRRVTRLKSGLNYDTPKSKAGNRVIGLPDQVVIQLNRWKQRQRLEKMMGRDRWSEQGWMFTTWKGNTQGSHRVGNHIEPRWVLKRLTDLLKKGGLEHMTVHGLRHTFCTLLLSNNVPVKDVQEIAGHSKPTVTLNTYWQSIPGAGDRVATAVAGLLPTTVPEMRFPTPVKGKPSVSHELPTQEQPSRDYSWFAADLNSK